MKLLIRTGKLVFLFLFILVNLAFAEFKLEAFPSSTEVGLDENFSVEFKVTTDQSDVEVGRPMYKAPDFDEVNVYSGSTGVISTYVNGVFSVKKTQSQSVVFHPKKEGTLKISDIHVMINGKKVLAPELLIEVSNTSQNHARGSGQSSQMSQGSNMPNSGVRPQAGQSAFFIKTEPSKLKVYKGEQILLTYALYTRTQVLGIQVERYPTVPGFLKEDIDIPLLSMRLNYSSSVVEGKEYNRAVLAQYAIYPVKDGKLVVDPLTGKFTVRAGRRDGFDQNADPFGILNQFFQSMDTTSSTRSSDRVSIEVLPLPAAGQPENFSGLVGDFDISAAIDKYSLKVGESLNVKVKIEGKGHAGGLERLPIDWPKDFELYEDKSETHFFKTGKSERIFDFMLIPKVKGKYTIPSIQLSMFNPDSKSYQVRKTEPIEIEVLEGSLGNVYVKKQKEENAVAASEEDIHYWSAETESSGRFMFLFSRVFFGLSLAFLLFLLLRLKKSSRVLMVKQQGIRKFKDLQEKVKKLSKSKKTSVEILAEIENCLALFIEYTYKINIRSLTMSSIREELKLCKVSSDDINKIDFILSQCINMRFAPNAASLGEADHQDQIMVLIAELSELIK